MGRTIRLSWAEQIWDSVYTFVLRTGKGYIHCSLLNHSPLASFIPKLAHIGNIDRPNLWVVDTLG